LARTTFLFTATFLAVEAFLGVALAGTEVLAAVARLGVGGALAAGAGWVGAAAACFEVFFGAAARWEPAGLVSDTDLPGAGLAALASRALPEVGRCPLGADDFSGFMQAEEANLGHLEG